MAHVGNKPLTRAKAIDLALGIVCLGASAYSFTGRDMNAAMLACCLAVVFFLAMHLALRRFEPLIDSLELPQLAKRIALLLCFSLGGGILLELLTLVGAPPATPLDASDWSKRRILLFSLIVVCVLVAVLAFRQRWLELRKGNAGARGGLVSFFVVFGIALGCCTVVSVGLAILLGTTYSPTYRTGLLAAMCAMALAMVVVLLKRHMLKVELVFLSLALPLGLFLVFALPPVTLISWDDQIHYERALGLSYFGSSEATPADQAMVGVLWVENNVLDHDAIDDAVAELDALAQEGAVAESDGLAQPISGGSLSFPAIVGALPSAVGLWLGRAVQLPYLGIFIFGRWANLIFFVFLAALAIRITPVKKILFAAVALLPTSLYLAANYSYDPWLTALIMLGVAVFLRRRASDDASLTAASFVPCLIFFLLALMVKAVYFPLLGILLLVPPSRFVSRREAYRHYVGVIAVAILLVLTFVLPMLFAFSSGSTGGDVRGGSDVSSSGQIAYILSNPLEYVGTLLLFMASYISPAASDGYSLSYAYMSIYANGYVDWTTSAGIATPGPFSAVPFIILVLAALTSRSDTGKLNLPVASRLWIVAMALAAVVLACTALYVSFTAVGAATVAGMQPRYLIPVLVPALLAVKGYAPAEGKPACSSCKSTLSACMICMALLSVYMDVTCVLSW